MKLYQLVASGPHATLGGRHKFHSKRVFANPSDAHNYAEEFKAVCCRPKGDHDLFYLERVDRVGVVELEL